MRRRLTLTTGITALLLALALHLATGPANADTDTVVPILTSVTRTSSATPTAPTTITIDFTSIDDSGLSASSAVFRAPTGATFSAFHSTPPIDDTISVTLPESAPPGVYELEQIGLTDGASPTNSAFYRRDGSVTHLPASSGGPSSHNLNFSLVDVTVTNPNGDATNPLLVSFEPEHPASGPAPFEPIVTVVGSDAGSGIDRIGVTYKDPRPNHFLTSGTLTSPGTVDLPNATEPGLYELWTIDVVDKAGNVASYQRDGTIFKPTPLSAGPTSHDFDFTDGDFTVTPSVATTSTTSPSSTSTSSSSSTTTSSTSSTTSTSAPASTSSTSTTSVSSTTTTQVPASTPSTSTTTVPSSTTTAGPSGTTTSTSGSSSTSSVATAGSAIVLSASTVAPGGTLGITSSGWLGPVGVIMRSEPVTLGTLTADAGGVVTGRVTIPTNASPGPHTLELQGTGLGGGARTATVGFTVASDLPRTGGERGGLLQVALVLVGIGCLVTGLADARLVRRSDG